MIVLVSAACASGRTAQRSSPSSARYTVRAGDTLTKIADRHHVSVASIQQANNIENPDQIDVGQVLLIPGAATEQPITKTPKNMSQRSSSSKKQVRQNGGQNIARFSRFFPVEMGVMLRGFDNKATPPREGIVIAAQKGARIIALADGTVLHAGPSSAELGEIVIIKHNNVLAVYTMVTGRLVQKGQKVKGGRTIGFVGQADGHPTPRIEFQIRDGRMPVDPWPLLVSE